VFVNDSVITRLIGIDSNLLSRALAQMEEYGVFSRRKDGAIYSRKMVRDEEIRQQKSRAGERGMEIRYGKKDKEPNNPVITEPLTNTENESEDENESVIKKESGNFYKWWAIYPRQINRGFAEDAWKQSGAIHEDIELILERTSAYTKYCEATNQKRLNPENWLLKKSWNNDYEKLLKSENGKSTGKDRDRYNAGEKDHYSDRLHD